MSTSSRKHTVGTTAVVSGYTLVISAVLLLISAVLLPLAGVEIGTGKLFGISAGVESLILCNPGGD